jgi:L-ascorbate 6-phosphate lactonase
MGGVSLTWLGQAGFLLELSGLRILIDPFLSDHPDRLYPPAATVPPRIDYVLVTHEHGDHFDPESIRAIAALSPDMSLVVPNAITQAAAALDAGKRVVPVAVGDVLDLHAGVGVAVVPAWHAEHPADGYSDGRTPEGLDRFVGYVLTSQDFAVYHSGDTLTTDGLLRALVGTPVDLALLPINGRDAEREAAGIAGNMDAAEAVALAEAIGAETLIPTHWDLVTGNTADPQDAVTEATRRSRLHVLVLARLRPVHLGPV